jgi:hypothetical protein
MAKRNAMSTPQPTQTIAVAIAGVASRPRAADEWVSLIVVQLFAADHATEASATATKVTGVRIATRASATGGMLKRTRKTHVSARTSVPRVDLARVFGHEAKPDRSLELAVSADRQLLRAVRVRFVPPRRR